MSYTARSITDDDNQAQALSEIAEQLARFMSTFSDQRKQAIVVSKS